jgi:PAS domain S-box-containing protein
MLPVLFQDNHEEQMTELYFSRLVDIGRLQRLLEAQHRVTRVPVAILDVDENVLVAVGWQEICTRFHRQNPEAGARCRQSDAYIKAHLCDFPEEYVDYQCRNGLRDLAMPIFIDGRHLATFFTGQFFYDDDPPDPEFFRSQAALFGFDEADYLAALKRVPVFSREYIRNVMSYCRGLVEMMAEIGLNNLKLAREVKERRKSEKEASFFRFLVENTRDPFYVLDPADGDRLVYVNPAACEHYGLDRETLLKMRIPDWDPLFDRERFGELEQQMQEHKAVHFETLHRVASGELIPVEVTASYFEHDGRRLAGGHFHDISERKAMETALKESEHNLTEAQRIARVGNWAWSLSGRLLTASEECWRILGTSPAHFAGTWDALLELIHPDDRERAVKAFGRLEKDRRPCSVEYRLLRSGGDEVAIREKREMVFDDSGRPAGMIGTVQDITEQVRLAETLREKDLLLMQQSRMAAMGEMISYIAHQWRQPLHLMNLLVQNLGPCAEQDQRAQMVDQVMDLIQHMSATIDDFRNFFRTDKPEEFFDLREATRKIVDFVAADLKMHNIELVFEAESDLIVRGHANEYSHVLLNILNNARDVLLEKGVGTPRIYIRLFREGAKKVVVVGDNAGGISGDLHDRVFDAYFTTKRKGTGIGLYISKIIIEKRLKGSLAVRNADGGAEFRIEI